MINQNIYKYIVGLYSPILVGIYSPIGSALECEASVLRSIHSSDELKGALRGPTTCSDPVGIIDWGGVLFISLRIWHLWGSMIKALNKGNTYLPSMRSE